MREGVLEGVFQLGEEAGLVEELRGLQVRQAAVQGGLGHLFNGLQECGGDVLAITAADWRRRLSSGDGRSIRAASIACTVAGICNVVTSCARR